MQKYKQLLGAFFILATIVIGALAIMVVLDITNLETAFSNGTKSLLKIVFLGLVTAVILVVTNSLGRR